MEITANEIDDLKTGRKDVIPPLPLPFRLIPIVFYGSVVFLLVVGSTALWRSQVAGNQLYAIQQSVSKIRTEIDNIKKTRKALGEKIIESQELEAWVLGSMPLQPLVMAIVRSISPDTSIISLSLSRDEVTPSRLRLSLRLNSSSDAEVDNVINAIKLLNYREFSPTQSMIRGNLEYSASLLWEDPTRQTPQERQRQGGASL